MFSFSGCIKNFSLTASFGPGIRVVKVVQVSFSIKATAAYNKMTFINNFDVRFFMEHLL
jgi:hypothetical protein